MFRYTESNRSRIDKGFDRYWLKGGIPRIFQIDVCINKSHFNYLSRNTGVKVRSSGNAKSFRIALESYAARSE